ncbi:hypothetical protein TcWFU_008337 [Taenia crassiceps]|uniref:Uncharacterized protein n=1 Tax=Taenia crassiceps TaxID=6207 RepID=A0ABR4Q311_9CEST
MHVSLKIPIPVAILTLFDILTFADLGGSSSCSWGCNSLAVVSSAKADGHHRLVERHVMCDPLAHLTSIGRTICLHVNNLYWAVASSKVGDCSQNQPMTSFLSLWQQQWLMMEKMMREKARKYPELKYLTSNLHAIYSTKLIQPK